MAETSNFRGGSVRGGTIMSTFEAHSNGRAGRKKRTLIGRLARHVNKKRIFVAPAPRPFFYPSRERGARIRIRGDLQKTLPVQITRGAPSFETIEGGIGRMAFEGRRPAATRCGPSRRRSRRARAPPRPHTRPRPPLRAGGCSQRAPVFPWLLPTVVEENQIPNRGASSYSLLSFFAILYEKSSAKQ